MIREHYVPLFQRICSSEKLADLNDHGARLFYVLLLTHCDSWGRCRARPRPLFKDVWSMYGDSPDEVVRFLDALEKVGLIRRYTVDDQVYLHIPDWEAKAGRVGADKRGKALFPEPPPLGVKRSPPRAETEPPNADSEDTLDSSRAHAQSEPSQAKQNRTERSRERAPPAHAANAAPPWATALEAFPSLDTAESREACERWVQHRKKRRHPVWDEDAWRANLQRLQTADRLIGAVHYSCVVNKYQSLQEDGQRGANGRPSEPAGFQAIREFLAETA